MEALYDLMDLPENLQRGLYVVRPIRGLAAAVMAAVLLYLAWLLWPWLWYFDLESTVVWTQQALATVQPTLGGAMPWSEAFRQNIGWFVTGITYLPTLVELFTVRFASGGIKTARVLVVFFSAFDLVTDWPRVSQFVDGFGLNGLLALALKIPLLLLASFGLQSLVIIFVACGAMLLLNVRRPVGRQHPGIAPAGAIDV